MSTIWHLFFAGERLAPGPSEKVLDGAYELAAREALKAVGERLPRWAPAARELEQPLRQMLGVGIQDILLEAWTTWRELREYADPAQHPPGEQSTYVLGRHTVSSVHHPKLEIRLNGQPIAALPFEVKLALAFQAGRLLIRDGRIWELQAGEGVASGTLKLGDAEIAKIESKPVPLPGVIELKDGIVIPR